ncbi:unnamed protein product [Rotaria socialis]|uniref:Uncharacterized protein n=1 Tax=Rotaria socialis TaxID=392032 RepID=A0A818TPR8_9BILA|nr:unnamed protein product [Rotaria socialis]CAF4469184.1 unnamed protein product [Rotaria socialis]
MINAPCLQAAINFITIPSHAYDLYLNEAIFKKLPLEQTFEMADVDGGLAFLYNPALQDRKRVCRFICLQDLFDETTVEDMLNRFQQLFVQLFSSKESRFCQTNKSSIPIKKLSINLPNESKEIPTAISARLSDLSNEVTHDENRKDKTVTHKQ